MHNIGGQIPVVARRNGFADAAAKDRFNSLAVIFIAAPIDIDGAEAALSRDIQLTGQGLFGDRSQPGIARTALHRTVAPPQRIGMKIPPS